MLLIVSCSGRKLQQNLTDILAQLVRGSDARAGGMPPTREQLPACSMRPPPALSLATSSQPLLAATT